VPRLAAAPLLHALTARTFCTTEDPAHYVFAHFWRHPMRTTSLQLGAFRHFRVFFCAIKVPTPQNPEKNRIENPWHAS
jgi:hypothetical protein